MAPTRTVEDIERAIRDIGNTLVAETDLPKSYNFLLRIILEIQERNEPQLILLQDRILKMMSVDIALMKGEFVKLMKDLGNTTFSWENFSAEGLQLSGELESLSNGDQQKVLLAITKLPFVRELSLLCNKLSSVPPEFDELQQLYFLDLRMNHLTSLSSRIGNLRELRFLFLAHNNLTSLPSQIGDLVELTMLDVSYNKLTTIPPEISKLKNLESLELKNNSLSTLPASICSIGNVLQKLNLFGNPIVDSSDSDNEIGRERLRSTFGSRVIISAIKRPL